jgi:putative membrane protein
MRDGTATESPLSEVTWRRLSPRMLLIHPVREVIRYVPVLLGVFIAGRGTDQGHWWGLAGLVVVLVLSVSRWATTRYQITADQVQLKSGLLRKRIITTPADRVRSVDVTARALHRMLGLARVVIGTGTSDQKKEGLELDGLTAADAYALRDELLHRTQADGAGVAIESSPEVVLLELDPSWVRFAPFTLSGAVTGLAILGFTWNVLQQSHVDAGRIGAVRSTSRHLQDIALWLAVVQVLAVIAVAVSALSVIGYLLAFWNFRLTRHPGGTLQVSRGLLTTRATSIEHKRLRGVGLSEPILLRAVGGARLGALATGLRVGRGAERGGTVLVPPSPFNVVQDTAQSVLDEVGAAAAVTTELLPHGRLALRRRVSRAVAGPVLLLGLSLLLHLWVGLPVWFAVGAIVLTALSVAVGLDRYRSLGHAVIDSYLVTRRGSIDRRRAVLETDGIIGWNIAQSLFQRRLGLVTLTATTAAGRQAYSIADVADDESVATMRDATPGLLDPFAAR